MTKRLKSIEEVEQYFPGFMVFRLDCTEQEIPRPKDRMRRKIYYSGKKKKHTVESTQVDELSLNLQIKT